MLPLCKIAYLFLLAEAGFTRLCLENRFDICCKAEVCIWEIPLQSTS